MHGPEPEGGHLEGIYLIIFNASLYFILFFVSGEEDCLYLNVIVPRKEINQNDKLDVIVHIHGGAFMFGSGLLYAGPKFIMDREVILVTLNYRLGPFGKLVVFPIWYYLVFNNIWYCNALSIMIILISERHNFNIN